MKKALNALPGTTGEHSEPLLAPAPPEMALGVPLIPGHFYHLTFVQGYSTDEDVLTRYLGTIGQGETRVHAYQALAMHECDYHHGKPPPALDYSGENPLSDLQVSIFKVRLDEYSRGTVTEVTPDELPQYLNMRWRTPAFDRALRGDTP